MIEPFIFILLVLGVGALFSIIMISFVFALKDRPPTNEETIEEANERLIEIRRKFYAERDDRDDNGE